MGLILDQNSYFENYSRLIQSAPTDKILRQLVEIFTHQKKSNGRLIFAGNGASSAISSHAALDFTKQGGLTSICWTDPSLVSAFSNDYGFDTAQAELFECYRQPGDILVLVSTSGMSPNVIELAKRASLHGHKIVSFTGKDSNNVLKSISDISLWVDSDAYNIVENIHMIWLGYLIDCMVGAEVYAVS